MFGGETGTCPHCRNRSKTDDRLATQCDRMLYHDYTHKQNGVVRCIRLDLKYIIYMYYYKCLHTLSRRQYPMRIERSVRIPTGMQIQTNRSDIFVLDKKG
ncbi:hypothetical protein PAEPH01_1390 [Pancytospora epiphaga]|nr:hypothetical protein PAEPH01_1390 [Pancytospora epiphaga]